MSQKQKNNSHINYMSESILNPSPSLNLQDSPLAKQTAAKQADPKQLGPINAAVQAAFLSVGSDLRLVEEAVLEKTSSDAELLTNISRYLHAQGGKRIRPIITLLCNKLFTQEPSADVISVAAGIELIHMATLLHDDIIDEAPKRRHQPSAYAEFGLAPSLLTGDFLLVRAFGLCAHLDDFVVEATEQACVELTEGEILETKLTSLNPMNFNTYEQIVGKKTASLFALAAKLGAYLAHTSNDAIVALTEFGYYSGIAFQMIDDILDITANEDLLGKPSGTDLRQHAPSLINVLWLLSGEKTARDFFASFPPSASQVQNAASYLKTSPILTQAQALAKQYANKANAALSRLPSGSVAESVDQETRNQLFAIVEYTLERCL